MVPDPYTLEKMALAHRQQLQHEAVHEQILGALPTHSSHRMRHLAAKLGTFLITLGTLLRQLEQPRMSIAVDEVRMKESLC
jgi:hypothetical protein